MTKARNHILPAFKANKTCRNIFGQILVGLVAFASMSLVNMAFVIVFVLCKIKVYNLHKCGSFRLYNIFR